MGTIFEKIIAREIPADIVYEDEQVLAFLDIAPVHKGHVLIVPKKPFTDIFNGDPETLARMMTIAQKIAITLRESINADGVNILMNNGEVAGQEVPHAHLHVIPRFEKEDGWIDLKKGAPYKEHEAEQYAEKIKNALG